MPDAIRKRVRDAFFTRLQTIAGVTVALGQVDLAADELPAVVLYPGGQVRRLDNTLADQFTMDLVLSLCVKADDADGVDDALDELYAQVIETVLTDNDLGLPDIVSQCTYGDLGDPFPLPLAGAPFALTAEFTWSVDYDTAENDPRSAP